MARTYPKVVKQAATELDRAMRKYPKMASAHEGYAIILEELDELKAEVWRKQAKHRPKRMKKEAIQVAAMALRFALEVCGD